MLMNLQVRDFAIVDQIDIEFDSGMTVLTGETGAGKSILVDALGLVLGERGSAIAGGSRAGRATAERILDQTVSITVDGAPLDSHLSDHFGVRASVPVE